MFRLLSRLTVIALFAAGPLGCRESPPEGMVVVTFPSSSVGAEADVLRRQLTRFMAEHPEIRVVQRPTPDAADQRHQLYVQWLNAQVGEPDILQLDVIWTPEFAAAGWLLPLDQFSPDLAGFFPATVEANRWDGRLFALPWFVDVGMLYWRTDLLDEPPATWAELSRQATEAMQRAKLPYGFVWQGARYEGLVTVFLECLGGFGGRILDDEGRVVVDSAPAVQALTFLRDAIHERQFVPAAVLTWQEEPTRFAFQNGQAVFLRNWPYAAPLLRDERQSKVAGKFAVAPMPAEAAGEPTAVLGGSQLAINSRSKHPEAAYAVIEYLTRPEQMLERARAVGQLPPRRDLYDEPEWADALGADPARLREIVDHAVPRPVTPVYTELSEILQIWLHRVLTRQAEPAAGLSAAAAEMRTLLRKRGLESP